jgi:hypothetical protein
VPNLPPPSANFPPREQLERVLPAGERALALQAAMAAAGDTPGSLLTEGAQAASFTHYPQGDVYDFASHAQFYYHVHRGGEHGHIHLFQRPKGMPAGLAPAVPGGDPDGPCHLVAVGFGADGWAAELFTTNRWVTGEDWYAADAVKAMLAGFRVAARGELAPVAAWLTALVGFYWPLIERLVEARDAGVAGWSRAHPLTDPLDDGALEITSRLAIDLPGHVAAARRLLGTP